VGTQLAKELGFDGAECRPSGSSAYACDVYARGLPVLRDCLVGLEDGSLDGVSHCERARSINREGKAWDDVERAFSDQGLDMTIAFPATDGPLGDTLEAQLSVRSSGSGRLDPRSVEVLVFPSQETAAAKVADTSELAELLLGLGDDFSQDRVLSGSTLRDGRVVVWQGAELDSETRSRVRAALDEFAAQARAAS
jgi:hypothetical protein